MYTPAELRGKVFKGGLGYEKKDVEQFLNELASDYELLLQENADLMKKIKDQSDSISYYKSIEKTLQKALILAEKTAQDTKATAIREAEAIEAEARANSRIIQAESLKKLEHLEHKTLNLIRQYDFFKIQFENMLHAQLDLINSGSFQINTQEFLYQNDMSDLNTPYTPGEASIKEAATGEEAIREEATGEIAAGEEVTRERAAGKVVAGKAATGKVATWEEAVDYKAEDGFEFIDLEDEV